MASHWFNTAETQFWRRGVHSEIDCSAASPAVLRQGDSSSSSQPPLQPLSFLQLVGLCVIPNAFPWPSPYMSVCPTSLVSSPCENTSQWV